MSCKMPSKKAQESEEQIQEAQGQHDEPLKPDILMPVKQETSYDDISENQHGESKMPEKAIIDRLKFENDTDGYELGAARRTISSDIDPTSCGPVMQETSHEALSEAQRGDSYTNKENLRRGPLERGRNAGRVGPLRSIPFDSWDGNSAANVQSSRGKRGGEKTRSSRKKGVQAGQARGSPSAQNEENQLVSTPSTGVITPDKGQNMDENLLVDATDEFSASTSSSAKRPKLQKLSTPPSTSFTRQEPSISEEDQEKEILRLERSAGLNSDSDVEDEDCLRPCPRRRHAGEFAGEQLSSELHEVLRSMHRRDDCALRESSTEDLLVFKWSEDPEVFTSEREIFTGRPGPTFPTEGMSPFQIFSKIWDEDIINLIVDETNKYAANLLTNAMLAQFPSLRKWTPITPQELWTFFGVIMLQGIIPLPVEKEYWTPCSPYLKLVNFSDIMPFHRFMLIKRCLHFVDNNLCARGIPTKLSKIQPIIDHLNTKFSSLYLPEQEINIDESLLLWNGRLSFSQLLYKATQVGIKSYELYESRTGYLWQMQMYTRSQVVQKERQNVGDYEGATSKTVLKLVGPLLNKGHTLIMDNFCNSPLLARTLKAQKTDVTGTLHLDREFVPDSLRRISETDMRIGEVAFSQTRDLTIMVWQDANIMSLISTYQKVVVGGQVENGTYRYKPKVVMDYDLSMGGVDKKDQLLQAFPIERGRNLVWYKKLFRRLLNVSIHNTFVMFPETSMAQRQFRIMLADEILQRFRPPKIENALPTHSYHFPTKTNRRKSRCKWCALRKVDACTVYKCDTCNVNLCIIGCFKDYHISQGRSCDNL